MVVELVMMSDKDTMKTTGMQTGIRLLLQAGMSGCTRTRWFDSSAVWEDKALPAALLRMQFHDCMVRGCDASILLDSNQTNLAEKDGVGNVLSVKGYEVIDDAKAAVEKVCPVVVSCADILTLAARDAIVTIGGPTWKVVGGRRDGMISRAVETPSNLPSNLPPSANYSFLVKIFAKKNLTEREMVVLSGAHTIGMTHCGLIESRLYNSTGPDGVDPTLDQEYAASLKEQSSQQRRSWFTEFAAAMEKLSNTGVKRDPEGEIRRHCRFTN